MARSRRRCIDFRREEPRAATLDRRKPLWKPGPEKQYYQIVTRRFAEFSGQKAAREAHQNEQALARTRLRLSRRPIFDASGKPHFWD
jgi:hypothetical protein